MTEGGASSSCSFGSQEPCLVLWFLPEALPSVRALELWGEVRLCWAQSIASIPAGRNLGGVCAKHDVTGSRSCSSLPRPGVACQYKRHVDMTFTSLEFGKGLAMEYPSAASFRLSNWANRSHSQEEYFVWNLKLSLLLFLGSNESC